MCSTEERRQGFTLIELSIVLVIIGLIVGGILVGRDLIKAAEVRAQLSQIEKYNQAVNTFRGKFGGLPGDLALASASQYGFYTANCSGGPQRRDGNGLIEGPNGAGNMDQTGSETGLFWQDLSSPNAGSLIDGTFPNGGAPTINCIEAGNGSYVINSTPGTSYLGDYFPPGKIGYGTYVYVYTSRNYNWYGLSQIDNIGIFGTLVTPSWNGSIPVIQTYNIDKKVDDGLPTTGIVQATFLNNDGFTVRQSVTSVNDTTTSCYNSTTNAYSIGSLANYGMNGNCWISFRFQ